MIPTSASIYAVEFEFCYARGKPTVCVSPARSLRDTGAGTGVDSAWEQEKFEARKMLENAAESHTSGARFVGRFFVAQDSLPEKDTIANKQDFTFFLLRLKKPADTLKYICPFFLISPVSIGQRFSLLYACDDFIGFYLTPINKL